MKSVRLLALAATLAGASMPVGAAEYPSRAVEVVAAGNAGGGLDLVARALESALRDEKLFPQSFLIKNQGGAGGNLAKTYVHQRRATRTCSMSSRTGST